jgi:hypothetical protein
MNLHTAELNFIAHRFARFGIKMEQIVVNWLFVDKCTFDVQNPLHVKSSAIYTPNAYEVMCRVARVAE